MDVQNSKFRAVCLFALLIPSVASATPTTCPTIDKTPKTSSVKFRANSVPSIPDSSFTLTKFGNVTSTSHVSSTSNSVLYCSYKLDAIEIKVKGKCQNLTGRVTAEKINVSGAAFASVSIDFADESGRQSGMYCIYDYSSLQQSPFSLLVAYK